MKTFSILLCLLVGAVVANASITNPVNPEQDRQMRLYVASYNQDLVQDDYSQDYNVNGSGQPSDGDDGIVWWTEDDQGEISLSWVDGAGGSGVDNWTDTSGLDLGDTVTVGTNAGQSAYSWPASSWPNVATGSITYTGWGSGLDDLSTNIGSPIIWEHCDIGVPVVDVSGSWTNTVWDYVTWYQQELWRFTGARRAQAVIKLQTGGKALSQRQNLIAFHGTATRIFPIKDPPTLGPGTIPEPDGTVAPQNITVYGKTLGGDGNLYLALPDNDEVTVTPMVASANYYTFTLTANKYTPVIAARGNGNNYDDLSVTNPKFCVGQQLTFWMNWNPPTTNIDNIFWHLPDKYVNQPTNYSATCTTYVNNDNLLTNATTQCWYVRDPGGACSVRETLHFANGQSVNIAAAGNFTIYRPSFTNFTQQTYQLRWDFPSLSWFNADMFWNVTVNSKYDGQYGFTQLLLGTGVYYGTGGAYVLDGDSEIYGESGNNGPSIYKANDPNYQTLTFQDDPGAPTYSMNLDFQDYLRFQPSGDGSIFVTIGKNGWSVNADYSVLSGIFTPTNIPPATRPVDNDEFPKWNTYRSGH